MQKFGQMTNYGNETYLAIQAWTSYIKSNSCRTQCSSMMMNTYHSFRKSVAIFPRSGQGGIDAANAI